MAGGNFGDLAEKIHALDFFKNLWQLFLDLNAFACLIYRADDFGGARPSLVVALNSNVHFPRRVSLDPGESIAGSMQCYDGDNV